MDTSNVTKTKSKKKKIKAFHQKRKVFRANEPRLAVLTWGITHSMNELNSVSQPVMLLHDDFKAYSKIKVSNHNFNKEVMPGHFKFKEYCPLVFRNLRERFGMDDQFYRRSFSIPALPSEAAGNSGSKFFQTQDRLFYIKCIESEEVEMMHHLLPKYHQYIVECHAETLLPQYMGMYRVTVDNKETYYIVIRSVFSNTKRIHKKYDLKGSRVDREVKESDKAAKELPTFKDKDFTKDNVKILVGEEVKQNFLNRLKKDVTFLSGLNIMDYSLLIGIHDTERIDSEDDDLDNDENDDQDDTDDSHEESPPSPTAVDGKDFRSCSVISNEMVLDNELYAVNCSDELKHEIYYMGIIDVLTFYGATKKAAHAAKTVKHGVLNRRSKRNSLDLTGVDVKAGAEISTVKPKLYADRFLEFVESVLV